jgi:hypothetical protein
MGYLTTVIYPQTAYNLVTNDMWVGTNLEECGRFLFKISRCWPDDIEEVWNVTTAITYSVLIMKSVCWLSFSFFLSLSIYLSFFFSLAVCTSSVNSWYEPRSADTWQYYIVFRSLLSHAQGQASQLNKHKETYKIKRFGISQLMHTGAKDKDAHS